MDRFSELTILIIAKSKTRFFDRNVLCMSANFAASKRDKMEVQILKSARYVVGTL